MQQVCTVVLFTPIKSAPDFKALPRGHNEHHVAQIYHHQRSKVHTGRHSCLSNNRKKKEQPPQQIVFLHKKSYPRPLIQNDLNVHLALLLRIKLLLSS